MGALLFTRRRPEEAFSCSRPPFSRRDRGSGLMITVSVGLYRSASLNNGCAAFHLLVPSIGFLIFQTPILAPRPGVWILVSIAVQLRFFPHMAHFFPPAVPNPRSHAEIGVLDYRLRSAATFSSRIGFLIFQTLLAPRPGIWILVSVWLYSSASFHSECASCHPPSRRSFLMFQTPLLTPRSGLPFPFGCRSASVNLGCAAFHVLVPQRL